MPPPPRPPRGPARPDPARLLAWRVLRAVDETDAYANLVLPDLLRESGLDERDSALVSELAYGTLRATGTLDHVIGLCSTRPVAQIDPPLRDAIRLGAYQLLRTRIPAHAAVAATVELARRVSGEGPGSFANAVLRKIAARDGDLGAPSEVDDPVGHLSITTAHPRWVVDAFVEALAGDVAEAAAALAADDARPEVHLVARPGRITRDALLRSVEVAGLRAEVGPWSPYAVRLGGGDPGALAAVRDGRAAVQDEGSQLAALVVGSLLPRDAGATVLDVCAGPGGKAALVAAVLAGRDTGDRLVATELHPHRARLTARAVAAGAGVGASGVAGTSWVVAAGDALQSPWRTGTADVVLLDAPCTGLGALRRRPEARWRRRPEDVGRLVTLQRSLAEAALAALRPGGHLVYVVCSPHVAEGREQIAHLLERDDVEAVDVRAHLPAMPALGHGPWVQLWPHRHETDAMFFAVLRRVARLAATST